MAEKLGALLLRKGLITSAQLEEVLQAQLIYKGRLGTNLVELGYLDIELLSLCLGEQRKYPVAGSKEMDAVPDHALAHISGELCEKHHAFPLALEGRRLKLVMAAPYDPQHLDALGFATGFRLVPSIAPELRIFFHLERRYGITRDARYIRLAPDQAKLPTGVNKERRAFAAAEAHQPKAVAAEISMEEMFGEAPGAAPATGQGIPAAQRGAPAGQAPQLAPQRAPQLTPQPAPQYPPQQASQQAPQHAAQQAPQQAPQYAPQHAPRLTPQPGPQHAAQNAPPLAPAQAVTRRVPAYVPPPAAYPAANTHAPAPPNPAELATSSVLESMLPWDEGRPAAAPPAQPAWSAPLPPPSEPSVPRFAVPVQPPPPEPEAPVLLLEAEAEEPTPTERVPLAQTLEALNQAKKEGAVGKAMLAFCTGRFPRAYLLGEKAGKASVGKAVGAGSDSPLASALQVDLTLPSCLMVAAQLEIAHLVPAPEAEQDQAIFEAFADPGCALIVSALRRRQRKRAFLVVAADATLGPVLLAELGQVVVRAEAAFERLRS